MPGFGDVPGACCRHLAPEFPGAKCILPGDMKVGKRGIPEKGFQNAVQKFLFQVTIIRFPCCVLLVLSWNTNENLSTDKLSWAVN